MGFLHAVSIWLCTLATLDGQPGPDRKMNRAAMVITAAMLATTITPLRDFGILARPAPARLALRRPRSMSAWVRCWADAPGQPGRPPFPMTVVRWS